MKRFAPLFLIVILLKVFLIAGCSTASPIIPASKTELILEIPVEQSKDLDVFQTYELAPGDVLDVLFHIRTWDENSYFKISLDDVIKINFIQAKDLSQIQSVRPDGKITLPYIGQVTAQGKTVDQLTQELRKAYSSILWNPDLYITVDNFRLRIQELKKDLHTAPRGLSRLVTIRPDGYVTFPMLGHIYVVGRTLQDVNEELNRLYDRYLQGLHVDLFLEKHAGSVVYVMGEVLKPGAYEVRRPITLLEAITYAGGYKSTALLDNAIVLRRENTRIIVQKLDLTRSFTREIELFMLKPDDLVFLPRTQISQTAEIMQSIGNAILFRGWGVGFDWELSDNPVFGD